MPLRRAARRTAASLLWLAGLFALTQLHAQQAPLGTRKAVPPRPEAVAETGLIMEGMLLPNFRGAEKILRGTPRDAESFTFTRGQALLIAEAGNLLLLRPPREQGQEAWQGRAVELREAATRLARHAADKDLVRARTSLVEVMNVCNRCHESFRVPTRLSVFGEEKK